MAFIRYDCRLWICTLTRFYHAFLRRCFDNTVLLKQSAYRNSVFLGRHCDVSAYKCSCNTNAVRQSILKTTHELWLYFSVLIVDARLATFYCKKGTFTFSTENKFVMMLERQWCCKGNDVVKAMMLGRQWCWKGNDVVKTMML